MLLREVLLFETSFDLICHEDRGSFREGGLRRCHLSRTALAGAAWHPYVCAPNRLEDGAAGQPALCLTAGRGGAVAARPNEVYGCKGRAFGKVGETFLR